MNPEEIEQLLGAIRSPDPAARARASNRLVEVVWKAVWGIVRATVAGDAADDVLQEVMIKILIYKPQWDPVRGVAGFRSYLRVVVASVRAEYFRRHAGPRPKPQKEDFEWLFETTRGGCLPPPKVLVGAFHVLLGMSIEQIAAELADRPMRELAGKLLAGYEGPARFEELVRQLAGPPGDRSLREFVPAGASTASEFEHWIGSVQRCAENRWLPDPGEVGNPREIRDPHESMPMLPERVVCETCRELLKLTDSPHKLIVFVLNKLLEQTPKEIRAKAALPLKVLYAEAKRGCQDLPIRAITANQWDEYFRDLEAKMAQVGGTTLAHYSKAVEVDDWARHIQLQFMTTVHEQEHDFLVCVFTQDAAHQSVAYGFGDLLKVPAAGIWQQSNDPLRKLSASLKSEYRERYDLAPAHVNSCFDELETRLDRSTLQAISNAARKRACLARGAAKVGDTWFNDYYLGSRKDEKLDEIRGWQRKVRARVRESIEAKGRGMLYAWVYGWLFEDSLAA
jgi:DNA-directed RNA polymerase specialized sigma24 family protein